VLVINRGDSLCGRCFPVNSGDYGLDAAAQVEVSHHAHPLGRRARYQIIEDSVDRPLIKNSVVPEAPKIELETFQLDALRSRNVGDADGPEIRSAALEQRELLG